MRLVGKLGLLVMTGLTLASSGCWIQLLAALRDSVAGGLVSASTSTALLWLYALLALLLVYLPAFLLIKHFAAPDHRLSDTVLALIDVLSLAAMMALAEAIQASNPFPDNAAIWLCAFCLLFLLFASVFVLLVQRIVKAISNPTDRHAAAKLVACAASSLGFLVALLWGNVFQTVLDSYFSMNDTAVAVAWTYFGVVLAVVLGLVLIKQRYLKNQELSLFDRLPSQRDLTLIGVIPQMSDIFSTSELLLAKGGTIVCAMAFNSAVELSIMVAILANSSTWETVEDVESWVYICYALFITASAVLLSFGLDYGLVVLENKISSSSSILLYGEVLSLVTFISAWAVGSAWVQVIASTLSSWVSNYLVWSYLVTSVALTVFTVVVNVSICRRFPELPIEKKIKAIAKDKSMRRIELENNPVAPSN